MVTVRYGGKSGKPFHLVDAASLLVVRTHNRALPERATLTERGRRAMNTLTPILDLVEPGVQVFAARRASTEALARVRGALSREKALQFVGRPLMDPISRQPVLFTENAFIKFRADVAESKCRKLLASHKLSIKRKLEYSEGSYFVAGPEGIGRKIAMPSK